MVFSGRVGQPLDSMCCSLLQCVAVCCSVLQCVAVCCSGQPLDSKKLYVLKERITLVIRSLPIPCVAVCCSVLQFVAACCSLLQRVAVCCSVLQCIIWHLLDIG